VTLDFARRHVTSKVQMDFVEEVRRDVLDKMLNLDIAYFTETKSGDIAYLQNTLIGRFSRLLSTAEDLLSGFLNLLVVGFLLIRMSWQLTALLAMMTLGMFFLLRGTRRRLQELGTELTAQSSVAASTFLEILYGIRLVKLVAEEGRVRDKYLRTTRELVNKQLQVYDHQSLGSAVTQLGASLILALSAIGFSVLSGLNMIENVDFMAGYYIIATRVVWIIVTMLQQWLGVGSMYAQYMRVAEFMLDDSFLETQASTGPENPLPLQRVQHGLSVEGVSFSYDGHDRVLDNVSLVFPKGAITALVGLSGSGKSTLLELLARFRYPVAGRVCVDGMDVLAYDLSSFRSKVGYVTQDTIVFNDTILENIRYLRPEGTRTEVEEAARRAMAHEFVLEAADGYRTPVGERGMQISGGQRQRIALARIFLQDPDILLLDEATSSVDLYTEARIFEELMKLKPDKVIVIAAHRLSAITRFDNIVVIHNGKVIEQGTHEELMAQQGLYFSLYKLQEYAPEAVLDFRGSSLGLLGGRHADTAAV